MSKMLLINVLSIVFLLLIAGLRFATGILGALWTGLASWYPMLAVLRPVQILLRQRNTLDQWLFHVTHAVVVNT